MYTTGWGKGVGGGGGGGRLKEIFRGEGKENLTRCITNFSSFFFSPCDAML